MQAVGIYLRTLREAHQLSRAAVAAQIGTHESQLVRIEAGEQDSRGSLLLAFVAAVKGRAEDIQKLLLDKDVTVEDGRRLASGVLAHDERDSILSLADTDEKRFRLLRRIAQLTENPELRAQIEGYLDGLESGR